MVKYRTTSALSCSKEHVVDNAIFRIYLFPADSFVHFVTLIPWIVIYPVDNRIPPLNNRALDSCLCHSNISVDSESAHLPGPLAYDCGLVLYSNVYSGEFDTNSARQIEHLTIEVKC